MAKVGKNERHYTKKEIETLFLPKDIDKKYKKEYMIYLDKYLNGKFKREKH